MMRAQLNGWQRLWVVVTMLWLLAVLGMSYLNWPTENDVSSYEVRPRLSPAEEQVIAAADPSYGHFITPDEAELVSDPTPAEEARVLAIVRPIRRTLLREKRVKATTMAVAAWSIPVALLYALGWSVGWARRRFSKTP